MTFIILFATSLILLVTFISIKAWQQRTDETLQTGEEWFRINLARSQEKAKQHAHLHIRRWIRTTLYRVLNWYRALVRYLRSGVRRRLQKILQHYDASNDPVVPQSKSTFLADVHSHKKSVHDGNEKNGIHQDFPSNE